MPSARPLTIRQTINESANRVHRSGNNVPNVRRSRTDNILRADRSHVRLTVPMRRHQRARFRVRRKVEVVRNRVAVEIVHSAAAHPPAAIAKARINLPSVIVRKVQDGDLVVTGKLRIRQPVKHRRIGRVDGRRVRTYRAAAGWLPVIAQAGIVGLCLDAITRISSAIPR